MSQKRSETWRDPARWGTWAPQPQRIEAPPPGAGPGFPMVESPQSVEHLLVFSSDMSAVASARAEAIAREDGATREEDEGGEEEKSVRKVVMWAWGLPESAILSGEDDMPVVVGALATAEDVIAAAGQWSGPDEETELCERIERAYGLAGPNGRRR